MIIPFRGMSRLRCLRGCSTSPRLTWKSNQFLGSWSYSPTRAGLLVDENLGGKLARLLRLPKAEQTQESIQSGKFDFKTHMVTVADESGERRLVYVLPPGRRLHDPDTIDLSIDLSGAQELVSVPSVENVSFGELDRLVHRSPVYSDPPRGRSKDFWVVVEERDVEDIRESASVERRRGTEARIPLRTAAAVARRDGLRRRAEARLTERQQVRSAKGARRG